MCVSHTPGHQSNLCVLDNNSVCALVQTHRARMGALMRTDVLGAAAPLTVRQNDRFDVILCVASVVPGTLRD